jgi:hypothetical protein
MTQEIRTVVELVFNIAYLLTIWTVVGLMMARYGQTAAANRPLFKRMLWMFALLALGDSGHVGFRAFAILNGGLEANAALLGIGALSTAVTVTVFYMLLVDVWRVRFHKTMGWFQWALIAAGVIRLVVMAFSQKQWGALAPPHRWGPLRDSFLVVQGLGVMALILRDARQAGDKPFELIGWMIALSYLFYAPVILWSAAIPLLGMLMIPKTCAYVAAAFIALRMMVKSKK